MDEYFPTVVQVVPLDNFHVQVFFDDGKIVEYDASRSPRRFPVGSLMPLTKLLPAITFLRRYFETA